MSLDSVQGRGVARGVPAVGSRGLIAVDHCPPPPQSCDTVLCGCVCPALGGAAAKRSGGLEARPVEAARAHPLPHASLRMGVGITDAAVRWGTAEAQAFVLVEPRGPRTPVRGAGEGAPHGGLHRTNRPPGPDVVQHYWSLRGGEAVYRWANLLHVGCGVWYVGCVGGGVCGVCGLWTVGRSVWCML